MRIRNGQVVFVVIFAVLLNVAVAWLCAYYAVPAYQGSVLLSADDFDKGAEIVIERDHELTIALWTAFGLTELDCLGPWYIWEPKLLPESRPSPEEMVDQFDSFIAEIAPSHDSLRQNNIRRQLREEMYRNSKHHMRIDAGWPMRSFRGFVSGGLLDPNHSQTLLFPLQELNVIARERPVGKGTWPRYLPYRPIWLGLIVNTLLYATVLIAIMSMWAVMRSKLRLRRGRCPNCKYPIGVSEVCTECGVELAEWAILRARARRPGAAR
ncbi:MAG: hypothetical protein V3T84_00710 [Phycisphaerales bacterium]